MLPVCQRQGLKEEGCGNISQRHTGVPLLCSHIRRESQDLICFLKSSVWWINALWDYFSPEHFPFQLQILILGRGSRSGTQVMGRKAGAGELPETPVCYKPLVLWNQDLEQLPSSSAGLVLAFLCLWAVSGMLEWTSCLSALVEMFTIKLQGSGGAQVLPERNFCKNFDLP